MIDFEYSTSAAGAAVRAAAHRGLPVPQEIRDAEAMWDVVVKAAQMHVDDRPDHTTIPGTPEELAAMIEERAHQHRIAEAHRFVSSDFRAPVALRFNALVKEQVPGWIMSLEPEFNALVEALTTQERKLPAELDKRRLDWSDPKVTAPWEKAESAAIQLDQLVHDRQTMAKAVGGDGGRDNELYAVAKIPEPTVDDVFNNTMRDEIGPALAEWRDLKGEPIARWLFLARSPHIELTLATPGEVKERAKTMQLWREALGARGVMASPHMRSAKAEAAVRAVLTAARGQGTQDSA